ncbi:MAG: hypothetical protein SVU32_00525, partial [Candidatus Nanohaloarchaea archaeon]|nr:hypothetical protein [Candidatus Nanohaloarchaea archaeon]
MPFEFLTPNLVAIAVIVAGIAYLVWRDRDKIERHSILIVRRTQHGIEFLDRMAKRAPMLWTVWSSLGVLVGFVVMAYMFFFLLRSTIRLLIAPEAAPSIGLVLPTASSQASFAPGVFFIPFWYWIIGIGTVMVA